MSKISTSARRELVAAVADRYQLSQAPEKGRILDEFVAVTGYHRKHAIRVLTTDQGAPASRRVRKPRLYDEAVRLALVVLWEAADRICSKRLKPLLPVLVPALERHGHLSLEPSVRGHVLTVSASTMDRLLAEPRAAAAGRRRGSATKPGVRRSIPIRTFSDWDDPAPGFLEVDLVSHCGGTAAGSFTNTLVLTDIATGWTECVALLFRESTLVVDAIERLRPTMPFPILGIDTDNGGEFVNETMLAYCKERNIELTRARPHRKNDQAWVEQKNGSVVRRLVGYGRFEGTAAAEALARMYCASRLFVNFFQPSFKLAEKRREGAKVVKRYHAPETPCARLLAVDSIADPMKERLRAVMAGLDPLRLLDEIRTVQQHLAGFAAGKPLHVLPRRDADLEGFLNSLGTAWRGGDVRPTHRAGPKPVRHWRTREDPFEHAWARVLLWLECEPERTAKELLERLQADGGAEFTDGHLRTLQRRVKAWRQQAARRLVFAQPLSIAPAQV